MPRKIAFIGLGVMGAPMARRLVAAGHEVTVFNRTAARSQALIEAGARAAASPKAAATGNGIVISMVTDSPDVEEVLLGGDGAVAGAAAGTTFIDMSTIAPATARRVGGELRVRGMAFLDAPVTGGDVGARDGTLSILVGGVAEDLDRVREILSALGKRITHCGPQGAGQTVKACNQILCALNMLGIAEAFTLAGSEGIEPEVLINALGAGAGGSWALSILGPRIARGDFAPGFMIDLLQKDLRIVRDVAAPHGLPLAGTALVQKYFADSQQHGEGALGTQALYNVLKRLISS